MRLRVVCASLVAYGLTVVPSSASAQAARSVQPQGSTAAASGHISMADAVQLALEHNRQLRAGRLNVDIAKADQITAGLKPNPVFTSTNENFPVFSPKQLTFDNMANNQNYVESFSYLFERGGKRNNRV